MLWCRMQILLNSPADILPRNDPPLQKVYDSVGTKIKELMDRGLLHIRVLQNDKLCIKKIGW